MAVIPLEQLCETLERYKAAQDHYEALQAQRRDDQDIADEFARLAGSCGRPRENIVKRVQLMSSAPGDKRFKTHTT